MRINLSKMLLILLATACFLNVHAQEKKLITGTVQDSDGNPVVAATVKEKGTTNSVTSDLKGIFKITAASNATLVISSIGFDTHEVQVNNSGTVSVQLAEASKNLTGVVVTALGIKRQKKSLGYAVQEIKGESLVDAREPNLVNQKAGLKRSAFLLLGLTILN